MFTVIILALSAGSVFLLSFICLVNPGRVNGIANRWLSVFLFCFGLTLLADIAHTLTLATQYLRLTLLSEITRFAMAPALYLSVSYFTAADRKFRKADLWHFIPCLLFAVNCLPALTPGFSGSLLLNRAAASFPVMAPSIRTFMFLVIKLQVIIYWIGAYARLVRHRKNVRLIYSSPAPVELQWLKYFLLGLLFMVLLWFNEVFFHIAWIDSYSSLGYLAAIYFVSHFALSQRGIYAFPARAVEDIGQIIDESNHKARRQERVAADKIEALKTRLVLMMETEKCFLDPDLGLPALAGKMNLSSHELSYVLNNGFGTTFFDFVNGYRVEEAKMLLRSDQHRHLSMVGIAYEAGFNSKTTFNTTFKKVTGLSPTAFQKAAATGEGFQHSPSIT